jgi:hypothetical protein
MTAAPVGTAVASGGGVRAGGDGSVEAPPDGGVAAVEVVGDVDEAAIRTAIPTPAKTTTDEAMATVHRMRLERGGNASVVLGGAVMASGEGSCTGFTRVAASAEPGPPTPDGRGTGTCTVGPVVETSTLGIGGLGCAPDVETDASTDDVGSCAMGGCSAGSGPYSDS